MCFNTPVFYVSTLTIKYIQQKIYTAVNLVRVAIRRIGLSGYGLYDKNDFIIQI